MKLPSFFGSFFSSSAIRELDSITDEIKINLANNYKSTAHAARIKLGRRCEELYAERKINKKEYDNYIRIFSYYTETLKDYHH